MLASKRRRRRRRAGESKSLIVYVKGKLEAGNQASLAVTTLCSKLGTEATLILFL